MQQIFAVEIGKEHLHFSAAHFMTFGPKDREPLHGHNYMLSVRLESHDLDGTGCVIDFHKLKQVIRDIIAPLDHRILLPAESPHLFIEEKDTSIEVTFGEERFLFPRNDCALIPISNSTAELLASYIGSQILEQVGYITDSYLYYLKVHVEESEGMSGCWVSNI